VAAQVGPADAVTALLKAGADRAAQTPAGETPLALARAAGRAEIVALLELPR
jgi:ankyrin repeat protein